MATKQSSKPDDPVVLVTGAASGLGEALYLYHYQTLPNARIICIDRTTLKSPPGHAFGRPDTLQTGSGVPLREYTLTDIGSGLRRHLLTMELDMSDERSMQDALDLINAKYERLDLIIHSAGVRGLVPGLETDDAQSMVAAENLANMNASTMMKTFEINTVASFVLLQGLVPLLRKTAQQGHKPKAVIMGSRMGSVTANVAGGAYAYRASKAALNTVVKSFSIDVPEVAWMTIHPGRVETGLTMGKEEGAFSINEVLHDMVARIEELDSSRSGRFIDRFGDDIAW